MNKTTRSCRLSSSVIRGQCTVVVVNDVARCLSLLTSSSAKCQSQTTGAGHLWHATCLAYFAGDLASTSSEQAQTTGDRDSSSSCSSSRRRCGSGSGAGLHLWCRHEDGIIVIMKKPFARPAPPLHWLISCQALLGFCGRARRRSMPGWCDVVGSCVAAMAHARCDVIPLSTVPSKCHHTRIANHCADFTIVSRNS